MKILFVCSGNAYRSPVAEALLKKLKPGLIVDSAGTNPAIPISETAKKYGIKHGEAVIIETSKGEITQIAHVTDAIHPNVINAAYGWWFPEGKPESQYDWKTSNFNMLTSIETLGKEFGTPNLKAIGCRIKPKNNDVNPT